MTDIDNLPADQRAVLSLVLRQGKSYAEVASLLRIDAEAVARRAHAALDALAPAGSLEPELRERIGDYLLGQQDASARAATREELAASAPARSWGRVLASELRPLATGALPEIPDEEAAQAPSASAPRGAARERRRPSSRLGGALLLGALGLGLAAIVIFVIIGVGGGSSPSSDTGAVTGTTATATTTTTTPTNPAPSATGASGAQVQASVNLLPVQPGSRARGVVIIDKQGNQRAFALEAQGLAPTNGFAYAVWLYNSAVDAVPLGFAGKVATDGKLAPVADYLPANASRYGRFVLTRETTNPPKHPGPIVLTGTLPKG